MGTDYYTERCRVTGFPIGTSLSYTDIDQNFVSLVIDDESYTIDLAADNDEDLIRASLDSITITAPPHSDVDFSLDITVTESNFVSDHHYLHRVTVLAVADPPTVSAAPIIMVSTVWPLAADHIFLYRFYVRPFHHFTISPSHTLIIHHSPAVTNTD